MIVVLFSTEFVLVLIIDYISQMVVGPLLAVVHIYSVVEEMRAVPVNTLNPQRTAMIVADFLKVCVKHLHE